MLFRAQKTFGSKIFNGRRKLRLADRVRKNCLISNPHQKTSFERWNIFRTFLGTQYNLYSILFRRFLRNTRPSTFKKLFLSVIGSCFLKDLKVDQIDLPPPGGEFDYFRPSGCVTYTIDRKYNVLLLEINFDDWLETSVRVWPQSKKN